MVAEKRSKPVSKQQKMIQRFIIGFGTFVFICFLFLDPVLRHFRKSDFKDAPMQEGVATVATLVIPAANFLGDPRGDQQRPLVGVRFRGSIYDAQHVYNANRLEIGKDAHIRYKVSKSGRISVELVEP